MFFAVPGPVSDLRSADLQPHEVTLLWDPPLAPNGQVTGYTVTYTGTIKDNAEPHNLDEPVMLGADANQYRVENLIPGYTNFRLIFRLICKHHMCPPGKFVSPSDFVYTLSTEEFYIEQS